MTSSTPAHLYVIALGSNRRGRHGAPEAELRAALAAIGGVVRASPIIATAPLGPSRRRFANAAALVESDERSTSLIFRTLRNTSRVYGNSVAKKAIEMEHEGKTIQEIGPIVAGARGRVVYETGDMEHGIWSAGTVMGIINDVPSCKELVERIVAEAEEMIRGRLAKAIAA